MNRRKIISLENIGLWLRNPLSLLPILAIAGITIWVWLVMNPCGNATQLAQYNWVGGKCIDFRTGEAKPPGIYEFSLHPGTAIGARGADLLPYIGFYLLIILFCTRPSDWAGVPRKAFHASFGHWLAVLGFFAGGGLGAWLTYKSEFWVGHSPGRTISTYVALVALGAIVGAVLGNIAKQAIKDVPGQVRRELDFGAKRRRFENMKKERPASRGEKAVAFFFAPAMVLVLGQNSSNTSIYRGVDRQTYQKRMYAAAGIVFYGIIIIAWVYLSTVK
jgi:hypothetical protein